MAKRRTKNTRLRGSKTHGWGAMKKHRGAGNRGGRGNAGSGKRGDAKKPSYWKIKNYYGKTGFTSHVPELRVPINAGSLSSMAERLVREGKATRDGKLIVIDLSKLGYNHLLGTGIVNLPLDVTAERASQRAIEKIEKAGGKVTVTAEPEETEEPVAAPDAAA
jgi:large subunit ribosomal protein L15